MDVLCYAYYGWAPGHNVAQIMMYYDVKSTLSKNK